MSEFRLVSFIRRGSASVHSKEARIRFCMLASAQPLLMHREPDNPIDSGAVWLTDLLGQHVGYVAREDAGVVSAKLAAGDILLCRTDGPCHCIMRRILIWSENAAEVEQEGRKRKRNKQRELTDG